MNKFLLFAALMAGSITSYADYTDYYRVYYNGEEVKNGSTIYCNEYQDNSDFSGFNMGYSYEAVLSCVNQTEDPMILKGNIEYSDMPTKEEWETNQSTYVDGTFSTKWGTPSLCFAGAGMDGTQANCVAPPSYVVLPDSDLETFEWQLHLYSVYTGTEEAKYILTSSAGSGDYTSTNFDPYDEEYDGSEFSVTIVFSPSITGAVNDIEADSDATPVYYDLQGRRIVNPSNGLYIVKKGSKVSKQFIR